MEGKKPDTEPAVFDSELGDDWGEAFEAEDYLAPPAATSDDFFLDETTPETKASTERGAPGRAPAAPPAPAALPPTPAIFAKTALLATVTAFSGRLKKQLLALSPRQKILAVGLPALLLLAVLFFALLPARTSGPVSQRPLLPPTTSPEGHEPEPLLPPLTALPETPPELPNQQAEPPPTAEPALPPSASKTAGAAERLRKKWPLPNFFIPVVGKTPSEPTAFVNADLTLTILLEGGADLPLEKELFLRDTIYQFYHNQPLPELRRYSLARHDMNQNLGSWLKKAWPELPLATIVFDHYAVQ